MAKKLTPKAQVLKVYPKAYAHQWRDGWVIYASRDGDGQGITISAGALYLGSAAAAWADAARRVVRSPKRTAQSG